MELLLPILSGIILFFVILITSYLAKIFKAKRHKIYWMVLPWVASIVAIVAANIFQLDGLYAIAIGMTTFILVLEVINGMKLMSALTITMASIAMLALFSVGALYGINQSGTSTHSFMVNAISLVPESEFYDVSFLEKLDDKKDDMLLMDDSDAELATIFTEKDLLPEKQTTQKTVTKNYAYRVVSPQKAVSMRGAKFRLLKHDGKTIRGNIVNVEGNKLIVGQYIPEKGMIKAPIQMNLIKKLEVWLAR